MATCNVVNVLCPNGRRQKVRLSPHMTLLQLIQEVCKKQSLNPNNCRIRHQGKILDSSLTVRFANLPNNAHLELIESAEEHVHTVKKCIVALQLESGDRLVHEFNSDDSLFKILEHWKSQSARISFDDNTDGIVCIYASQQFRGLEKLKSTTLSMIGLNGGRGVIRLIQPSLTQPEKDGSDMMEGLSEKATSQNNKAQAVTTPSVPTKLSAEEMEVASRSASSVSMTSQGSEDDVMQCVDPVLEPMPHSEKSNLPKQSDSEASSRPHNSKKGGKGVKGQDLSLSAMDIEQEGSVVEPAGGVDKESAPLSPSASTSRSAVTVEVFSGVGRTLGESGPDVKKARLHSPPLASKNNKTNSDPNQDTSVPTKDYGNVGVSVARETTAFRLGDGVTTSPDDVCDDFFEVTVDDLRLMLKGLRNERTAEASLMTQGMREEREKSRMDQYEKVVLRVYFPDRSVLQGFFSPRETVSDVNLFVKDNLQERDKNFYLYTTPPRTLLNKPSITLVEAKLAPTAVIHFGSPKIQGCYLRSNIVEQMTGVAEANEGLAKHYSVKPLTSPPNDTPAAAGMKESKSNGKDSSSKPLATVVPPTTETQAEAVHSRDNVRRNANQAAPKWFKLGK